MFAKLFGENDEQVLVLLHTNEDDEPLVEVYCKPNDMGVCKIGYSFKAPEDADQAFDLVDEAKAQEIAGCIKNMVEENS